MIDLNVNTTTGNVEEANVGEITVSFNNQKNERVRIKLQIWDTAGEEKFRSVTPMYYKNASAVILMYDSTKHATFKSLERWLDDIEKFRSEDN